MLGLITGLIYMVQGGIYIIDRLIQRNQSQAGCYIEVMIPTDKFHFTNVMANSF